MYKNYKEVIDYFIFIAFFTCIAIGIWIAKSHYEARSYNNLTGKQVSTWDAMFLELRIQESVK